MAESLKFGTSGLRGLASELAGPAARRYVAAFLRHLEASGQSGPGQAFIGRDLRASSAAIAADCAIAIRAAGLQPVDCGVLPTPALALHAMALGGPAIMVTGSHIPADRNGLKFYSPAGEITKADEPGILGALTDAVPDGPAAATDGFAAAGDRYRRRYLGLLAPDALSGMAIGVFEHSSVARDILCSLLYRAGAHVERIARSDRFVAVDTEAFSDPIYAERGEWIRSLGLDAVVSTDGDGDRPLLIDETGSFVRGDAIGLLTARALGADLVVTPVTSNSAIEASGFFPEVARTRVGSPYVLEAMEGARGRASTIVGFEANGGVMLGSDARFGNRVLSRLPTRDAVLPILAVLAAAAGRGVSLSRLMAELPLRAALSDRLTEVPPERSAAFLKRLEDAGFAEDFFAGQGTAESPSLIDGPRFTLGSGEVVHYRASGNAPELRCYVEAPDAERAADLLRWGLQAAAREVR